MQTAGGETNTEQTYQTLVYNLVYLLQLRLRKFYLNESLNEKTYLGILANLHSKIRNSETQEQTKFSEAIKDLMQVILF